MGKRGTPRASCDPCRLKKVKCDREQRIRNGEPACSYCVLRGYSCAIADSSSERNAEATFVLGIPGLTKSILDQAVQSYLTHEMLCKPAVIPDLFLPRYNSYFEMEASPATSGSDDTLVDTPIPEALILAVACMGIARLTHLPDRFAMQRKIIKRVEFAVEQRMPPDTTGALEYIQAALVVWDAECRLELLRERPHDPLRLHPLSDDAIVRLVLQHRLHLSSSSNNARGIQNIHAALEHQPSSPVLVKHASESLLRILIFWIVYADEALFHFERGELPLIQESQVDPPPVPDDFGSPFFREIIHHLLSLAMLLRRSCTTLFSARAQRQGMDPVELLSFLDKLSDWYAAVPGHLKPSFDADLDQLHGDRLVTTVQQAFLQITYLGTFVCIHILSFQLGIHQAFGDQEAALTAMAAVNTLFFDALNMLVPLCSRCAQSGILDYSNMILRSVPRGAAHYTLMLADLAESQGLYQLAHHLVGCSCELTDALSTTHSHPMTETEVPKLKQLQTQRIERLNAICQAEPSQTLEAVRTERESFSIDLKDNGSVQRELVPRTFRFDPYLFSDTTTYFSRILEEPILDTDRDSSAEVIAVESF